MTNSMANGAVSLGLGPDVIALLIPQRWPMSMVDRIERLIDGPKPVLEASRHISAGDIIFQGHFPGLHLWPGALTIEGLGQVGILLTTLLTIREQMTVATGDPSAWSDALRNLERGFTMQLGFRPDAAKAFREMTVRPSSGVGVAAAVNVKLRKPVFAGQRLDYRVTLAMRMDQTVRYDVVATVDDAVVADGSITGALVGSVLPPDGAP